MKTFGSCRRFLFLFLYFVISKLITTNASTTGHEVFNLEQIISENNTQELTEFLKSLNESCLTTESLTKVLPTTTSIETINRVVIYYLQMKDCIEFKSLDDIPDTVSPLCRKDLMSILEDIKLAGRIQLNSDEECLSAADLQNTNCSDDEHTIEQTYATLFEKLQENVCILPSPQMFVNELFSVYEDLDGSMNETSLSELLHKLKIGSAVVEDDHEDHEDHEVDHDDHEDHEGDHEDYEEDHEDHDHHRRKRSEDKEESDHNEDHVDDPAKKTVETASKCYSVDEYISMAVNEVGDDSDHKAINKEGFKVICPALVQQVLTGNCAAKSSESSETAATTPVYTTAQKYGYGTASVFLISMLAFVGLLVMKGIGKVHFKLLMQFFVALGIGTLSGDAILHLIPEVVGLHGHDEGHEGHDHGEEEEDKTYVWRLVVVIGGIYLFYLFENFLKLWNQLSGSNISFHVHPDDPAHAHDHEHDHDNSHDNKSNKNVPTTRGHKLTSFAVGSPNPAFEDDAEKGGTVTDGEVEVKENNTSTEASKKSGGYEMKNPPVFWGITAVGIMVWLGDALHNFGDGIALGAAFSSSWVSGVGTSIAIFCHELPHEFGDFAIYLQNGMSKWKALMLNFLAACFSFIGLYIGLSLSEHGNTREWLLAVIAGMFLYISLVDIMHEMTAEKSSRPVLQFLIQNVGLILGWSILLLLALYEEDLITLLSK